MTVDPTKTVEQQQNGGLTGDHAPDRVFAIDQDLDEHDLYEKRLRRTWPPVFGIATAIAAAGALAALFFWPGSGLLSWLNDDDSEKTKLESVDATPKLYGGTPTSAPTTGTAEVLADEVRGSLTSSELLQRWLGSRDWLRRLTAALNAIADGHSPQAPLSELRPEGPFQVMRRRKADKLYMAKASCSRYDALTRAFLSIRPARAAQLYTSMSAAFEQAQREMGPRDRTFRATIKQAAAHLLATPVTSGSLELKSGKGATYHFKKPQFEKLSAAQKHLLRMGPRNARAVKRQLRALVAAIDRPGHTASR